MLKKREAYIFIKSYKTKRFKLRSNKLIEKSQIVSKDRIEENFQVFHIINQQ